MISVFVVHTNAQYDKMFRDNGYSLATVLEDSDLVVFTGGADVSPNLYQSASHPTTRTNSIRDEEDVKYYEMAQELGIPCVGICRGAQFLNVMCGGSLKQDVDNHTEPHKTNFAGMSGVGSIVVTSTHHQMMSPKLIDCTVLLRNPTITTHQDTVFNNGNVCRGKGHVDYECVWYEDNNCLCFQPHPEYEGFEDCTKAFFFFINNYSLEEDLIK